MRLSLFQFFSVISIFLACAASNAQKSAMDCAPDQELVRGSCTIMRRSCSVQNGIGTQRLLGESWAPCVVSRCNRGYRESGNACNRAGERPAYTVNTTTELESAMYHARGGDIIEVAPGYYSRITIIGQHNSPNVIVRAADRNNPPVLRGLDFDRDNPSSGYTLDGLNFVSNRFDVRPNGRWPKGRGLDIQNTRNFNVRNCIFEGFHEAMQASSAVNLVVEWNEFRRIGMDSIRLYNDVRNIVIRGNRFHLPKVDTLRSGQWDRHPDYIQFAAGRANGVLIENNIFITLNGYHQVIFMLAESVTRVPVKNFKTFAHRNVTVRGNYIRSAHVGAIVMGGVYKFSVESNIIRQLRPHDWRDNEDSVPRFLVIGRNVGLIHNNVVPNPNLSPYQVKTSPGGPEGSLDEIDVDSNVRSETASPEGYQLPIVGPYGYTR